jgi:hypothetical protein
MPTPEFGKDLQYIQNPPTKSDSDNQLMTAARKSQPASADKYDELTQAQREQMNARLTGAGVDAELLADCDEAFVMNLWDLLNRLDADQFPPIADLDRDQPGSPKPENKFAEELTKVSGHWERFAEEFRRTGMPRRRWLDIFIRGKARNPGMTAADYCHGPGKRKNA